MVWQSSQLSGVNTKVSVDSSTSVESVLNTSMTTSAAGPSNPMYVGPVRHTVNDSEPPSSVVVTESLETVNP